MVDQSHVGGLDRRAGDTVQEYLDALRCVALARRFLMLLLIIAFLVPFVVYLGVHRGMITSSQCAPTQYAGDSEAPTVDKTAPCETAKSCYQCAQSSMLLTSYIARFAIVLLILSYFLAVQINLLGHLGGAKDAIAAVFWMVFLMLLIVPWQQWFGAKFHVAFSVFYDVDTLIRDTQGITAAESWYDKAVYYGRYLLFPFLGLVMAAVADLRFWKSYKHAMLRLRKDAQ